MSGRSLPSMPHNLRVFAGFCSEGRGSVRWACEGKSRSLASTAPARVRGRRRSLTAPYRSTSPQQSKISSVSLKTAGKTGCLITAFGFIGLITAGIMGAENSIFPATSIISVILVVLGPGILLSALIARIGIFLRGLRPAKPQERDTSPKLNQGGVSPAKKPTVPPSPVSRGRSTFNMPINYGSAFGHDPPFNDAYDEGNSSGRDKGYQSGYDEGLNDGYAWGSEDNYDDHTPEGAEWRHPDDDPTAR